MKLSPDLKQALEGLYLHHAVALDQLKREPVVLKRITSAFNGVSDTNVDAATLHRYMVNRRKNGDWPCLGARARRFKPAYGLLTAEQLAVLEDIYVRRDVTSDEYLFGDAFAKEMADKFARRTGTIVPAATLLAVIFAKRKRGEWVTIREQVAKENKAAAGAFSDLAEVDRIFKEKKRKQG